MEPVLVQYVLHASGAKHFILLQGDVISIVFPLISFHSLLLPQFQIFMAEMDGADHRDTNDVAALLEDRARATIQAINERNFDLSSPEWSHINLSPAFRADAADTMFRWPSADPHFETHADVLRSFVDKFPNYHLEIQAMFTEVSKRHDSAQVYINLETFGYPRGILLHTVLILEFRFVVGYWMCVNCKGMRGME